MRESFVFYRSFFEALLGMDKESQADCLMAIADYALNGTEPTLTPTVRMFFTLIKPQLDANNQRFENGCKGGRPKKEESNQEKTKQKPKNNQAKTEPEPNVNDNVNDNVNVNNNIPPKNIFSDENIILSPYKGDAKCSCDCKRKAKFEINGQKYCGQHTRLELSELGRLDLMPESCRFIKPTLDEVKAYCLERNNNVDAEKWFDYYTSNGWRVGKNPMKDWRAAVRTWEKSSVAPSGSKAQVDDEFYRKLEEL